jgi:hypothetical protein
MPRSGTPRSDPIRKQLIRIVVVMALGIALISGIHEKARERHAERKAKIERSERQAIDRACADWNADAKQFAECAGAFRAYEKCETAWLATVRSEGTSDNGVTCEHPTFQFHARNERKTEALTRGESPGLGTRSDVQTALRQSNQ